MNRMRLSPLVTPPMRIPVFAYLLLFTVSGFAGLIYESIWSHYLKLFLGHAAYAQTLVLALFMGGMALGSAWVGRRAERLRNALLGYALAELLIGLLALAFHSSFLFLTEWAYASLLPGLEGTLAITAAKWMLALVLLAPPSFLLGTTFPLMAQGVMRRYRDAEGRHLPALYFTNSLGAALGVLASGFVLIELAGLPGTMLAAGAVNILLALVVWLLGRGGDSADAVPVRTATHQTGTMGRLLILAALITGAMSFALEIAWIRMLSLAVGASTHSFEVMLSAFILGIALGGLLLTVVQRRWSATPRLLAWIIAAKAVCALVAVMSFPHLLDLVAWFYQALAKSPEGYSLFVASSYGVSALMMLPTAICAGMTLPLITRSLLAAGESESAIGRVYAANTLGAILGTVLATHLGMEWLGVKGISGAAAAIELTLAVVLLHRMGEPARKWLLRPLLPVGALLCAYVFVFQLDPLKLAAGVFRDGKFFAPGQAETLRYRDGRTATISSLKTGTEIDIRTNGKPDASINMAEGGVASADEHTMVMLAVVPYLLKPDAKIVANIGFGSGLTTHVLLGNPNLQRLDSIEIERQMIEGARVFLPRNARAYEDPRSNIVVEDAKTYFAAGRQRYDVIVSEPSNPWVSGVATLFSEEFYGRIRNHLKDDGLLVQWIQLYETKPYLIGSVMKALGRHFDDYAMYRTNDGDMMIVASPRGKLPQPSGDPFKVPALKAELARLDYTSLDELSLLRIASRKVLEPLFESMPVRPNSDFFPVVDLNAPRERFVGSSAAELIRLGPEGFAFPALVEGEALPRASTDLPPAFADGNTGYAPRLREARRLLTAVTADAVPPGETMSRLARNIQRVHAGRSVCNDKWSGPWMDSVQSLFFAFAGTLDARDNLKALESFRAHECHRKLDALGSRRWQFLKAYVGRDAAALIEHGSVLAEEASLDAEERSQVLMAVAGALLVSGRAQESAQWVSSAIRKEQWPRDLRGDLLRAHVILASRAAGSR
jgi:spermidine synthase